MAHYVQAFITHLATFEQLPANCRSPHMRAIPLPQGFALLPIVPELAAELSTAHPVQGSYPLRGLYGLTPELAELGRRLARFAPAAYFETDYFGGTGTQAAVVWERGAVALGPLVSEGRGSVSAALRRLGVRRGQACDEFEALGLGQCRSSAEWFVYAERHL